MFKAVVIASLWFTPFFLFAAAKERPGYVYIIQNPAFADSVYKIGMTTRNPEKRLKELSGSSVPHPFRIVYLFKTDSPRALERDFHKTLAVYRIRKEREFFMLPEETLNKAVSTLPPRHKAQKAVSTEKPLKKSA